MAKRGSSVIAVMIGLVIWLPIAFLNGIALSYLWNWFFVPVGMPTISYAQAIGVGFLVTYMTHQPNWGDKTEFSETVLRNAIFRVLRPVIGLGTAWVYLKVFF